MPLLEVREVSVHYGRIQAISDVSVSVEEGEVVSLIGANGAGKSTSMIRAVVSASDNPSAAAFFWASRIRP